VLINLTTVNCTTVTALLQLCLHNRCVFQWQRQRAPFTPPGAADGIESANATLDAAIKAETTPRRASAVSTAADASVVRGDLAYTRDGALAYTAGPALVLHTATAKAQRSLVVDSSSAAAAAVVCAAVTGSGAYAATADAAGAVRVWDVQRGAVVCVLPKGLRDCARLAFSGDGKSLAGVDSANDSSICVWETATGKRTANTSNATHLHTPHNITTIKSK
jgi:WD40 repeat protein